MVNKKAVKFGLFALVTTAVLLAVLIVLNLLVTALPEGVRQIDVTKEKAYTIGDVTRGMLDALESDVTITMILENGSDDDLTSTVRALAEQYARASSHVKFRTSDPEVDLALAKDYSSDELKSGVVIVSSGEKSRLIGRDELMSFVLETGEELTFDDYSYYDTAYYEYYGRHLGATRLFYAESKITGAITFVTSANSYKIYALDGEGELKLEDGSFKGYLDDMNIEVESLNLNTGDGKIPDDCTMILIYGPTADLSASAADELGRYLTSGGSIFLLTSPFVINEEATPNILALAKIAGMVGKEGAVFETSTGGYSGYPYILVPSFADECPAELIPKDNYTMFMAISHGIEQADGSGFTYYPVLNTSSAAYVKDVKAESSERSSPFTVSDTPVPPR